jgi:hypothetical protein
MSLQNKGLRPVITTDCALKWFEFAGKIHGQITWRALLAAAQPFLVVKPNSPPPLAQRNPVNPVRNILSVQSYDDDDIIDIAPGKHLNHVASKVHETSAVSELEDELEDDDWDEASEEARNVNHWSETRTRQPPMTNASKGMFAMTAVNSSFESAASDHPSEAGSPLRETYTAQNQQLQEVLVPSTTVRPTPFNTDIPISDVHNDPTVEVPITGRSEGNNTAATDESASKGIDEASESGSVDGSQPKIKSKKSIFGRLSKSVMKVVRSRSASPTLVEKSSPTEQSATSGNLNADTSGPASGNVTVTTRARSASDSSINTVDGTVQDEPSSTNTATGDKKSKSRWSQFKKSVAGSMGIAYSSKPKIPAVPLLESSQSGDSGPTKISESPALMTDAVVEPKRPQDEDENGRLQDIPSPQLSPSKPGWNRGAGDGSTGTVQRAKTEVEQPENILVTRLHEHMPPPSSPPKPGLYGGAANKTVATVYKVRTATGHPEKSSVGERSHVPPTVVHGKEPFSPPPAEETEVLKTSKQLAHHAKPSSALVKMDSDRLVSQILTEFVEQGCPAAAEDLQPSSAEEVPNVSGLRGSMDTERVLEIPPDNVKQKDGRGLAARLRKMLPNSGSPSPEWVAQSISDALEAVHTEPRATDNPPQSSLDLAMSRLRSRSEYVFQPLHSDYRELIEERRPADDAKSRSRQHENSKVIFGDFDGKSLRTNKHFPVGHSLLGEDVTEEDGMFYQAELEQESYTPGSWKYYADCLIPLSSTFIAREKRLNETVESRGAVLRKALTNRTLSFHHNVEITPFCTTSVFRRELLTVKDLQGGIAPSESLLSDKAQSSGDFNYLHTMRNSSRIPPRGGMKLPDIYGLSYPVKKLSDYELYSGSLSTDFVLSYQRVLFRGGIHDSSGTKDIDSGMVY